MYMNKTNNPDITVQVSQTFAQLISKATERIPLHDDSVQYRDPTVETRSLTRETVYTNANERLGIDFEVERLDLMPAQTLDPRIVRIRPGCRNEYHKHAHESLFVVLSGHGSVLVGEEELPAEVGDVLFVPRWVFHQTCNLSKEKDLVVLAITDFGFTSSLLGNYDKRTRLKEAGEDVQADSKPVARSPQDFKESST